MTKPLSAGRQSAPDRPQAEDAEVRSAFRRTIEEGEVRLGRTWPGLLSTGLVGGGDLSVGVLALLVVEEATGSRMLGALAFTVGFISLALARSELFTENFLVPVVTVVARQASVRSLARLWLGTLVMNLVGGWVVMAIVVTALPRLRETAVELGSFYPELGITLQAFALAVLGGAVITLYTWMERNSESEFAGIVAAVAVSFLLVAGPLNHVVVSSVEMFAALHVGAPFGYLDWLGATAWSAAGNIVGGLAFVTLLRLVQVGREEIRRQQDDSSTGARR